MRRGRLITATTAITAALLATVAGPASARGHLTIDRVYSAPAPSLCGYPAGRLVRGRLPGTAPDTVELASRDLITLGRLQPYAAAGAADVVYDQGGVAWSQTSPAGTRRPPGWPGRSSRPAAASAHTGSASVLVAVMVACTSSPP